MIKVFVFSMFFVVLGGRFGVECVLGVEVVRVEVFGSFVFCCSSFGFGDLGV